LVDSVNGEGVIGLFPEISREMTEPFVYESCTPIETRDGKMWGEFDFIVQSGPEEGTIIKAAIEPYNLVLQPGTELKEAPFFQDWMN